MLWTAEGFPQWYGLFLVGALLCPGALGLAASIVCAVKLRSRRASGTLIIWGLVVIGIMYAAGVPYLGLVTLMVEAGIIGEGLFTSIAVVLVYSFIGVATIVGIAVVLWRRTSADGGG